MKYEYEGPAYVRPFLRGFELGNRNQGGVTFIETALTKALGEDYSPYSGWEGHVKVTVEFDYQPEDSSGRRKLSNEDVEAIRGSDETQSALAERYGVTQGQVSRIKSGHSWRE
jgi:hypothetical protein